MRKRVRKIKANKSKWFILLFFVFVILAIFLFFIFQPFFTGRQIQAVDTWRSSMFPENWQPIDKIGAVEGTNVFTDPEGTKDENGNAVTSGPNYHPYRFLHDFSYAGYKRGEQPIPPEDLNAWTKTARVYDVTKSPYNCVADGTMDCKAGIQRAITDAENAGGGIVYLPQGEYRITASGSSFLRIQKSRIVLRGDGPDKTKIKVDPYLANGTFTVNGKIAIHAEPTGESDYGWSVVSNQVTIIRDLPFPTKVIPVSSVSGFAIGDPIIIEAYWTDAYVAEHDMTGIWQLGSRPAYTWRRTIQGINSSTNELIIDVPTRYRVKTTDGAIVAKTRPGIAEIGVEHLALGEIRHPDEWPDTDTALPIVQALDKHYIIAYKNVRDGWIYDIQSYRPQENANRPTDDVKYGPYDVEILNMIVYFKHAQFVTLKDFYFKNMQVDDNPGGGYGYGITLFVANDILVTNGTMQKVKKGYAFNRGGSSGNVIKDVVMKEVFTTENDFHSYNSMSNLIDNNDLQGTYWEAAVRPIGALGTPPSTTDHGHGTSETVFWNTRGTPLTIPILDWWDRDNNNDNKRDSPAIPDPGSIVSNQFGWGYIIGTYGPESRVVASRMPDRAADLNGDGTISGSEIWHPYILPRDWMEGIGYDDVSSPYTGKTLCPRSLYEAQLAIRLGRSYDCQTTSPPICLDSDGDGFNQSVPGCGITDCDDTAGSGFAIHPGALEICGDGIDNDCAGGDLICPFNGTIVDNVDPGFSIQGTWTVSGGQSPYGVDSVFSRNPGDQAIWSNSLGPGVYDVYAWWTYWPSRSQNAPYFIYNGNTLLDTVRVNQRDSSLGGKWNFLGEYTFDQAVRVVLSVESNDSYNADAVGFTKVKDITGCTPLIEICDGKDNDCDGQIDENVKNTYYHDGDGDTYGNGSSLEACAPPIDYVSNNLDCDDVNASVNLLKSCSYNGGACGTYSLCVASCPVPPPEDCTQPGDENCDGRADFCSSQLPALTITYPLEGKRYKNQLVPLKYSATNALNCWYTLNSGNTIDTPCFADMSLDLPAGDYLLSAFANNSAGQDSETRNFRVQITRRYRVRGDSFIEQGSLGLVEDYTDEQLENISSFSIELPGFGKIEWLELVNLTQDANKATLIIDLEGNVNISFNKIEVKSDVMPSLNKRARITLYGLQFRKPRILRDGLVCYDCILESYTSGVLVFIVPGFSIYSTEEIPSPSQQQLPAGGGGSPVQEGNGTQPLINESTAVDKNLSGEEGETDEYLPETEDLTPEELPETLSDKKFQILVLALLGAGIVIAGIVIFLAYFLFKRRGAEEVAAGEADAGTSF